MGTSGGSIPGQHKGLVSAGSALPSWKVAFETTSISSKSSQGKVPCRRCCHSSCCLHKTWGGRGRAAERGHRTMANWLVNHWFSAAVLVSLGAGAGWDSAGRGARGAPGGGGDDELLWGWALGRDEHPLCSAKPGSQGRAALCKIEVLGQTQLTGKLKNAAALPSDFGSFPRASSPLVRGGGSCESSWQGEELAPWGPSASAVLQHLWCDRACLACTHQLLSAV